MKSISAIYSAIMENMEVHFHYQLVKEKVLLHFIFGEFEYIN